MKLRVPYPVVLSLTAILAASLGSYYLWKTDTPPPPPVSPPATATSPAPAPALDELRAHAAELKAKMGNAWTTLNWLHRSHAKHF